ncbi:hypothetical protein ACFXEL_35520 [Streptomyces sp. NPDC059382]|uniref:hypothetical protein n=1 Tax=Streptomyces sp. NPDC059382 TaxID=3346816 RepID=UPI0036A2F19E
MKRLPAWIGAAALTVPLLTTLGSQSVQAAPLEDVPLPLPLQRDAERLVRPGERVSVTVGLQDAITNDHRIFSPA